MDLKSGQAILSPAKGESFDPAEIPGAVKKAGFTAGEIEVTAVGRLGVEDGALRLRTPGSPGQVILLTGGKAEELRAQSGLLGRRIRVTGIFQSPKAGELPSVSVNRWESLSGP